MAIGRKKTVEPVSPKSLIASAVRVSVSDAGWNHYRFTDEGWQTEAWRQYDINEQLHNAADYVGSACSLVRVYVAHVDENGTPQGEVLDEPEVASLADTIFGGPSSKAEILRSLGTSITVAGECYLIGIAGRGTREDSWIVAAPSEVRKLGRTFSVDVGGGQREELNPMRDIIIRMWTPHPRRSLLADSPVRACLPLLYEMEQLRGFLNSQLNSRIANATVWPVPSTLAVPRGDAQAASSDDVYEQIYEVITSNLAGKGTAAQVAPILWPMPLEELKAMAGTGPISFESPLSEQAIKLREEAQRKLAIGMNVPIEIQLGGQTDNHWRIWWAGEEFILKSVTPIMNRIVNAITLAYLTSALKALGKDPKRYTFWYDTAPLANSANKLADTLNLYQQGIVSSDEVLRAGGYNESAAPSQEEETKRFVKEVILRDPALFASSPVRESAGIFIDTALPESPAELSDTPAPPPPAPDRGINPPEAGRAPQRRGVTDEVVEPNGELIASARPGLSATSIAANGAVVRALELAGKRLLTPSVRGLYPNVDPTVLHTRFRLVGTDVDKLLTSAWDRLPSYFDGTGVDSERVRPVLDRYVRTLLTRGIEHRTSLLAAMLEEAGV